MPCALGIAHEEMRLQLRSRSTNVMEVKETGDQEMCSIGSEHFFFFPSSWPVSAVEYVQVSVGGSLKRLIQTIF